MTATSSIEHSGKRAAEPVETPLLERLRAHWPLGAVLGAFVLSMFIVPTLAHVAISDDWVFMWSAERLVDTGKLEVHPLVSPHLVFQAAWGALFGVLFGVTPGVLRVSVIVLWLFSGIAFYGIVWELTGKRALSALGATAYLFNPLGYALAFTFMTDVPLTSLSVIALYCAVRAVRDGIDDRWILGSALASACALLVRQPGIFLPVGVLAALLLSRRLPLRLTTRAVIVALEVGAIPLIAYGAYRWWLLHVNGVPAVQSLMQEQLLGGGWGALGTQAERLAAIEAGYIGLFVLPLTAGALLALRRLGPETPARTWVAFVIWMTAVVSGMAALRALGMRMPYVPHFLSMAGLGPNDLLVARSPLAGLWFFTALTLACAVSAVVAGFLVIRAVSARLPSANVTMVLVAFGIQAVLVVIVSTHFRYWTVAGLPAPSLDRYLLPLLPLALALVLWSVRDVDVHLPLTWYVVGVLAVFAVVGTRDNLAFHQAQWALAQEAVDSGIPLTQLDGGGSWTGYYLGERSYAERGIHNNGDARWWLTLYGSIIDPEYAIATKELPGYTTVSTYPYDLWLDTRPTALYLLHRNGTP
ncbi:MAG: glycosyltransferase family 39 protein [Dehalococcoidia bacterium]|nr:glycosyltransferase family 39 protein [Dehalococcoidia bacterium]